MQTLFENQYTISKERYMEWAKNPLKKNYFVIFWLVLMLFAIFLLINAVLINDVLFSAFYLLVIAFCIYRAFFRTKMLISKQFKSLTIIQRATEWQRIIEIADHITVTDGNTTTQYQWSQIKELLDHKNYLVLVFQKGLGIRLDKQGFTKGSCDEFLKYIKDKNIKISK
jgi:hypothetical protein